MISSFTLIVISVLFPFGITLLPLQLQIINVVAAMVIALLVSMSMVFRYKEQWVNYRLTAELLKREKLMYDTKTGKYSKSDTPEQEFINGIERIISNENTIWLSAIVTRQEPR